jgi:hypothetical protein
MTVLEIKAAVRDRDGHACTKCGMSATAHRVRFGRDLEVHRKMPGSAYTIEGCVTLCRPCHWPEPKSPHRSFPNSTAHVVIPADWYRVIRVLAKSRGMRINDYLISCVLDEAEEYAELFGEELPVPPWVKRLHKQKK